jgi:hypothetical protein
MTYRATNESSTQTNEERADEARKIIEMGLADHLERMTPKERDFVERIAHDSADVLFVSVKQLWWLRDLKERYLL